MAGQSSKTNPQKAKPVTRDKKVTPASRSNPPVTGPIINTRPPITYNPSNRGVPYGGNQTPVNTGSPYITPGSTRVPSLADYGGSPYVTPGVTRTPTPATSGAAGGSFFTNIGDYIASAVPAAINQGVGNVSNAVTAGDVLAKQNAADQQALMDWLMGKDVTAPTLDLPNQGPLPDINFSDLLAPYQGAITSANDMVQSAINASASQNAAQNAALRSQLATNYSDTAGQYKQAAGQAQTGLENMANQYGVGQALAGTGQQMAGQQDARMQGLFAAQQAGGLSSLDVLSNMKGQSFDVAKNLAAGYGAQNLSQLANTLSQADIQEELTRRQNENDLSLAGLQAKAEMAKLGAGMKGDEQTRRFNIWKLMNDLQIEQAKTAAANAPEITTTQQMGDPQLRATIDSITDPDVKRAVVDAVASSDDPGAAYAKLQAALVASSPNNPFVDIGNAIGLAGQGKLLPKQVLVAAMAILEPYNQRLGGTSQRTQISSKQPIIGYQP